MTDHATSTTCIACDADAAELLFVFVCVLAVCTQLQVSFSLIL